MSLSKEEILQIINVYNLQLRNKVDSLEQKIISLEEQNEKLTKQVDILKMKERERKQKEQKEKKSSVPFLKKKERKNSKNNDNDENDGKRSRKRKKSKGNSTGKLSKFYLSDEQIEKIVRKNKSCYMNINFKGRIGREYVDVMKDTLPLNIGGKFSIKGKLIQQDEFYQFLIHDRYLLQTKYYEERGKEWKTVKNHTDTGKISDMNRAYTLPTIQFVHATISKKLQPIYTLINEKVVEKSSSEEDEGEGISDENEEESD